jgi:hypothetical protein
VCAKRYRIVTNDTTGYEGCHWGLVRQCKDRRVSTGRLAASGTRLLTHSLTDIRLAAAVPIAVIDIAIAIEVVKFVAAKRLAMTVGEDEFTSTIAALGR